MNRRLLLLLLVPLAAAALAVTLVPRASRADTTSVTIQNFAFSPASITVPVGTTVTWTNQDDAPHTSTSDTGVWASPMLARGESFSFTFTEPGSYPYHCDPHPFMEGMVNVTAAGPPPARPTLTSPPEGEILANFGPTLAWNNPEGATQVQLQVIPSNNDGPGVDLHLGSPVSSFAVPPPPQWYGMLPGMTYTWRVRTSGASTFVAPDDPSWSAWAEGHFRTPSVTSATLSVVTPPEGAEVSSRAPTLQWSNSRSDVFYYEVQVSQDRGFNTDPATAVAMVYWELRHGGVTNPPNSYTIPTAFPLAAGTTYHWRVRPRIQGDGAPIAWSPAASFRTANNATVPAGAAAR